MKTKHILTGILIMALAVRIILMLTLKTYQHPVVWEYEEIADNMLAGKGFVSYTFGTNYRSLNAPIYSFLCAGTYLLANHSFLPVLLVQFIFSLFLTLVVFSIARRLFGERTAVLAALVTAIHPGFIYYDVFNLIPLSIDAFFIATSALLFLRFMEDPTTAKAMITGAVIGIGALTRGITGSLLPFLIMYIFLFMKDLGLLKRLKAALWMALATFILISPWLVRNFIIHKEFIFLISTTGENLWRGNNQYAVGTSLNKDGKPILELWPEEFKDKIFSLDEIGQKKFFEREAISFILNNPLKFLTLYFKKIFYFWWFSPQSGIIYPRRYLTWYRYLYSVFLPFFMIGLGRALASPDEAKVRGALLLIFIFASICVTQSLFYVEGRHRWIIEPLLAIFFSYGVNESYIWLKDRLIAVRRR